MGRRQQSTKANEKLVMKSTTSPRLSFLKKKKTQLTILDYSFLGRKTKTKQNKN